MIRVYCIPTGEVVETDLKKYKMALNHVKGMAMGCGVEIHTKNKEVINNIKNTYEDKNIKAEFIPGDWRR